ncbi:MAG: PD40 domain-containing protein [Bacteroidales bacterium]|nr:PD40 domain-containing protein [Bacteroidales bacterium]
MYKFFCSIFVAVFLSLAAFSQTQEDKIQSMRLEAEYFFFNGDYEKALEIYKDILKEDPENCNINYKIGICYQRMPFEAGRSINYLKKAVKEVTPDYIEGSASERKAPITAWYALARGYHTNKFYEEGVAAYQQYIDRLSPNELQARKRAMREMISCRTAAEIIKKPVPVEIFNIGNVLNTEFNDFNPCPTADGKLLFFTRLEKQQVIYKDGSEGSIEKKLRIYMTRFLGGEQWSAPRDISDEMLTFGNCSVLSVNAEGTFMLLCKHQNIEEMSDILKGGTLYYSTRPSRSSSWSMAKKFGKTINVPDAMICQAAISDDGNTLYVASNKEGGMGGYDIWKSVLKNKSKFEWSKLENLGKTINTEYDESSPYILADGKTLYFTSVGHYNMGGFDVFKSVNTNGVWSEPENLGHPINTPDDNMFYKPSSDGKQGFYSVAFNEGYFTFGGFDIFQVDYVEQNHIVPAVLKGTIAFEDKANKFSQAKILVRREVSNVVVKELHSDSEGNFECFLDEGSYVVEFVCADYLRTKRNVVVEKSTEKKEIDLQVTFQVDDLLIIDDIE